MANLLVKAVMEELVKKAGIKKTVTQGTPINHLNKGEEKALLRLIGQDKSENLYEGNKNSKRINLEGLAKTYRRKEYKPEKKERTMMTLQDLAMKTGKKSAK